MVSRVLMGDQRTFVYKDVTLTYQEFGTGKEIFLAFHGFGQSAGIFKNWPAGSDNEIKIYSFNLFFHGSIWPYKDKPISQEFLSSIIAAFIKEKEISKYSLLAYSIGAKLALVLINEMPSLIKQLILIAPDGIRRNLWYKLATGTLLTRWLFRLTIENPKFFLKIADWASKLRFVHPSALRFAQSQMRNKDHREKVYYTWIVMRKLFFQPSKTIYILNDKKINIKIFLGEADKIIPVNEIRKFVKKIPSGELIILKADHHKLVDQTLVWMKEHQMQF